MKNKCRALNHYEHFLNFVSVVSECVSFNSLHSSRHWKCCSGIKNLCSNCRNYKILVNHQEKNKEAHKYSVASKTKVKYYQSFGF